MAKGEKLRARSTTGVAQPAAHEALAHQAHCDRERNESQVERETLAPKVEALQAPAVANASTRQKLRKPGDSRPHSESPVLILMGPAKTLDVFSGERPRTDDAHFPAPDVNELRQFIQSSLT